MQSITLSTAASPELSLCSAAKNKQPICHKYKLFGSSIDHCSHATEQVKELTV